MILFNLKTLKTVLKPAAELERVKSAADEDTCGLKNDSSCVICYEYEADHVLLPCGHGGYCRSCTHTLMTQPAPNRLCPVCRSRLGAAVQVSLATPIGSESKVVAALQTANTGYYVKVHAHGVTVGTNVVGT